MKINIEKLLFEFDCDYKSGTLYRIEKSKSRVEAGHLNQNGYVKVGFDGELHYAHRLIWAHFNRENPIGVIDHIDRNPSNNSIDNLRDCSLTTNQMNRKVSKNNSSGVTGVHWLKSRKKWKSVIYFKGKQIYLGLFESKGEAEKAYAKKKQQLLISESKNHEGA